MMTIRVTLRIACLLPCPGIDMAFPVAGHLRSGVRLVSKARVRSHRPADVGVLSVNHCAVITRLRIPRSHPPEKPREMIRHHPVEKRRVFDRHACLSRFRRRIPPREEVLPSWPSPAPSSTRQFWPYAFRPFASSLSAEKKRPLCSISVPDSRYSLAN